MRMPFFSVCSVMPIIFPDIKQIFDFFVEKLRGRAEAMSAA